MNIPKGATQPICNIMKYAFFLMNSLKSDYFEATSD